MLVLLTKKKETRKKSTLNTDIGFQSAQTLKITHESQTQKSSFFLSFSLSVSSYSRYFFVVCSVRWFLFCHLTSFILKLVKVTLFSCYILFVRLLLVVVLAVCFILCDFAWAAQIKKYFELHLFDFLSLFLGNCSTLTHTTQYEIKALPLINVDGNVSVSILFSVFNS